MSFAELIRARHAVRAYRPDPVPDELLAQVLEAGRLAPTAANRQPIRILVVHTAGREAELAASTPRDWFTAAPVILGVCTVPREAWMREAIDGRSYADVDAAIVMDHLVLAATDLGLGTCWVAAFDPAVAREVAGPAGRRRAAALHPLGFPADEPRPKERRPLAELVHLERW